MNEQEIRDLANLKLLDENIIRLNADDWERFAATLAEPPKANEKLRKLLQSKTILD